jgi:hypothetical protein
VSATYAGEASVVVQQSLQADREADIARAHHVAHFELGELGREVEFLRATTSPNYQHRSFSTFQTKSLPLTCITRVNLRAANRQLSSLVPPVMTIYSTQHNLK